MITIIILLILAAVSVVALRDTSLFERTQRATQVYNESRLDEEEKLEGYKYAIDEHTAGVATINKLKGSAYLNLTITTDDYVTATVTATKTENSSINLTNYKIMMASGDSDFVPEESDWEEKNSIEVTISENKTVYAVLYDGTKYGANASKYVTMSNVDIVAPTATFAELKNSDNVLFGVSSVVTASDLGSGVNYSACKYVFNNSADPLGENADLYTDGVLTGATTTAEQSKCSKPGTATFYLHVLIVDNAGNKQEQISTGKSLTIASNKLYSYTGAVQPTKMAKGTYQLEVWGAQGGVYRSSSGSSTNACRGGYSKGTITLKEKQNAYIYAGGQGNSNRSSNAWVNGGFNGGGKAVHPHTNANACNSGGGASDIRFVSDTLYNRIIVAGGGGGYPGVYTTQYDSAGYGYGGGSYGCDPYGGNGHPGLNTTYAAYYYSKPTTLWTPNFSSSYFALPTFGNGGYVTSTSATYNAGGGGGWYGGLPSSGYDCGGGGSGWINTSGWYNTWKSNTPADANQYAFKDNADYYLSSTQCSAGNSSFVQPTSTSNETGHGYARITNLNS